MGRVMFCLRSVKPRGQLLLCQEGTVLQRRGFAMYNIDAMEATVVVSRGHYITKKAMFAKGHSDAKRATLVSRGHCITKRVRFCLRSVKPRGKPLLCLEDTVSPRE